MRLTISYRGILRDPDELESILDDVFALCVEIGWHYMPIHRSNVMPTRGIMITPVDCEPIWLTFLPNGKLYDPSHFIYTSCPDLEKVNEELGQWIEAKTYYAGIDTHMAIIKFFRYLHLKYFEVLELHDQSQYWETDNVALCLIRFYGLSESTDYVERRFDLNENDEDEDDEELESVASRMEEALLRRGGAGASLN